MSAPFQHREFLIQCAVASGRLTIDKFLAALPSVDQVEQPAYSEAETAALAKFHRRLPPMAKAKTDCAYADDAPALHLFAGVHADLERRFSWSRLVRLRTKLAEHYRGRRST
jgi:hypothetical protein